MREIGNPVSPCDDPCDVAIPLVYPMQPIPIPVSAVREKIPFDGIDVPASMQATFTDPDSRPPLSVQRVSGGSYYVLGLGHAGIAIINGRTGGVKYAEYGRYDAANRGLARWVPAVESLTMTFTDSGNPDPASMAALGRQLVATNGGPYAVEGIWVKLRNGAFGVMQSFINDRIRDTTAGTAAIYDVTSNHCFTFAREVARSAGVNTGVSGAPELDLEIRGGNFATRGLVAMRAPTIEVPARQIKIMQNRYRDYRLNTSGRLVGSEYFPRTINGM
ncbi:hypothetical protein [Jannaschia marina]|uniref:hypothetical protein n=1 Tax=Jannaschia marina TaxID=2741674 RepID=UPI0015C77274|nr:hypothetical protein [Jannaschia marina]